MSRHCCCDVTTLLLDLQLCILPICAMSLLWLSMSRKCFDVAVDVLADVMAHVVATNVATLLFYVATLVKRCHNIDLFCSTLLSRCRDFVFSMSRHCFSVLSLDVDVATLINRCRHIAADVMTLVTQCCDILHPMSRHCHDVMTLFS